MWDEENDIKYFIASAQEFVKIRAIRCPDTISVYGTGYSDGGDGLLPGSTTVATDVPWHKDTVLKQCHCSQSMLPIQTTKLKETTELLIS